MLLHKFNQMNSLIGLIYAAQKIFFFYSQKYPNIESPFSQRSIPAKALMCITLQTKN